MTRIMGDTTHANVSALNRSTTLQLVAGYDTGTPDIKWISEDWAMFPDIPHVHIDQGYGDTRSAEAHVVVFDVETGAFRPDQAESLIDANQTARPTIYTDRFNLAATIASAMKSANWKGDIWLAYPGWRPGLDLPAIPPGTRFVAVQTTFMTRFDLSTVLDNSWPGVAPVPATNWTEEIMTELPTLSVGAIGAFVRRIQGLCIANHRTIVVDGNFGPLTKQAVISIQAGAHITVDGIVGQETWSVLLGV